MPSQIKAPLPEMPKRAPDHVAGKMTMAAQIIGTIALGVSLMGIIIFAFVYRPLDVTHKEKDPRYFSRKKKNPTELSTRGLKLMFCANPRGIVHDTIRKYAEKQNRIATKGENSDEKTTDRIPD